MTRILKISAIAMFSMVILWACGGGGATPKDVAKSFLEAMEAGDSTKAQSFATEATKKQLTSYFALTKEATKRKVEIVGEPKMDGETKADVTYKLGDDAKEKTLKLVKDGEAWKAEWSKMGDMGGMGDMMKEAAGEMGDAVEGAVDGAVEGAEKAEGEDKAEGEHKEGDGHGH